MKFDQIEKIKELMQAFDEANLTKLTLSLEEEGLSMSLEKGGTSVASASQMQVAAPVEVSAPLQEAKQVHTSVEKQPGGIEVKSPLVGVFYQSSSPDSAPFVKEGDKVKKGQTLCIIEAMKVMNEITAPCDGVVDVVLCQDGDMVEFEQPILIIS